MSERRRNSKIKEEIEDQQAVHHRVMDSNVCEGTLSAAEFDIAARVFVENWKRTNSIYPPWSLVSFPKQSWLASNYHVDGYLTLERICLCRPTEEDGDEVSERVEEDPCCCGSEGDIDAATLVPTSGYEVRYFDFHIIYSTSYMVPVLYFRAYFGDGRPLTYDELEKDLPFYSSKILRESKWTFITQEEHPYLKRPWYKLHPCGTSEWMKLMLLGENHIVNRDSVIRLYLASWLSFVGQVVGLVIPLKMLNDNIRQNMQ